MDIRTNKWIQIVKVCVAGCLFITTPLFAQSSTIEGASPHAAQPDLQQQTPSSPLRSDEELKALLEDGPHSYEIRRPIASWQVDTSFDGPGSSIARQLGRTPLDATRIRGVSTRLEFQPPWVQQYGVIGVGPALSYFPTPFLEGRATSDAAVVWSLGGVARYQARYLMNQFLVPEAAYGVSRMSYRFRNASNGQFNTHEYHLGLMLLLNNLERVAAGSFFAERGVSRTYLIAEFRRTQASDDQVTLDDRSVNFGLRFEF